MAEAVTAGRWRRLVAWVLALPWRRIFLVIGLVVAGVTAWLFLPQPDAALWPPTVRDDRNVVYVSLGPMHAAIDIPDYETGMFQEWHMGARTWYIDFRRDWGHLLRGLFTTSEAVIRFGLFQFTRWERESLPPDRVFKFWLSDEGRRRMIARLHRDRGAEIMRSGGFVFFEHRRPYWLLANCNGYIGGALEAAGLPIREVASVEPHVMEWQLRRCVAFQGVGSATVR